jgi:uncharacterized protein (UPF0335 family)
MSEPADRPSHQRALASLAILKVDLDEGVRDYIGYLETLVLDLLARHKPDPVIAIEIAQMFEAEYGLRLPEQGIQLVLRRLARRKYLRKSEHLFHVVGELPATDMQSRRATAAAAIDEVFEKLRANVRESYGIEWSIPDASRALLGFLNIFGIDYIRAFVFRTATPRVPERASKTQFIVGKFIGEAHQNEPTLFDKIMILVKGQMYANALICPDLESIEKDFRRVTFYFDTPLILNALGLQVAVRQEATREITTLIARLKGKVAVFQHTIDEVDGVLEFAEQNIDRTDIPSGRVLSHLRAKGIKRGDIALIRGHLEDQLKQIGFAKAPTPRYVERFNIDEAGLEQALKDELTYRSARGAAYDVNSIRSIFALREGQIPKRLEDCKAVFVTSNSGLARIAFEKGQDQNSAKEVSSVITDYSLGNVAWLKAPLGAPDLPEKETLAACYAAMEPSAELLAKYVAEIDRLREKGTLTSDDHALLRVSGIATDELMNLTLGDEEAFGAASVPQILERVRTNLVAKQLDVLRAEREAHQSTILMKDQLAQRSSRAEAKLFWISEKIAKVSLVVVSAVAIATIVIGAFASTILTTPWMIQSTALTSLVNGATIVAVGWGIVSGYNGMSLLELARAIEERIRRLIFGALKSWLVGD